MKYVLIKDMKMPERCDECRLMVFEDTNCVPELYCGCPIVFKAIPQGENNRPDYCPLVELPPHGDLIDREKTVNRITELSGKITNQLDYYASAAYTLIALFLQNKHEFPTVIEAEDGE